MIVFILGPIGIWAYHTSPHSIPLHAHTLFAAAAYFFCLFLPPHGPLHIIHKTQHRVCLYHSDTLGLIPVRIKPFCHLDNIWGHIMLCFVAMPFTVQISDKRKRRWQHQRFLSGATFSRADKRPANPLSYIPIQCRACIIQTHLIG